MTDAATSPPMRRLIVGCGYLGERVARRWLKCQNTVYATTRSTERAALLVKQGVQPIIGDVTAVPGEAVDFSGLPEVETVLWCIGFDRTANASYREVHIDGLKRLLDRLPGQPRVLFASSTGVWGEAHGAVVDESTPPFPIREAGQTLVEAEKMLTTHPKGPGVVLRFAGLYGPNRLPRLDDLRAARPLPANPESWLNLIHIEDAADVVCGLANLTEPQSLYVVSDGTPILRKDWYTSLARATGSPSPIWEPAASQTRGGDKRLDSRRLWTDLNCHPRYPDAIEAIQALL